MRTRQAAAGLVLCALGGCIDFVAPDLPQLGAPVVLQGLLRLDDGRTLRLDALLAPGLDEGGRRRTVPQPAARLQGIAVAPDSVLASGAHAYGEEIEVAASQELAIEFRGPEVNGVDAPPPEVHWPIVRRLGPDTVRLNAAGELVLPLALPAGMPAPPPDLRQWVVALAGDGGAAFTIAASGAPPAAIVIPAQWIPASSTGTVNVRFTENLSVQLRPAPGDYIGLIRLDNTIRWTVRP